jgi:hypothetical protein
VDGHDANIKQYLKNVPVTIYLHEVNGYNIGSPEEKAAMDLIETKTVNTTVRERLQMFRLADPRRYSMWFGRYWAWRALEQLTKFYDFDFIAFTRPDLLWLSNVNTFDFFKAFESKTRNDVWVHDV